LSAAVDALLDKLNEGVMPVLRDNSAEVDRESRLPVESLAALKGTGLFDLLREDSRPSLTDFCVIAETLATGCGSTAMIWAMHHTQYASVIEHAGSGGRREEILTLLAGDAGADQAAIGPLIASVTSEVGTGGDMSRSLAPVQPVPDSGQLTLRKRATTISYADVAELFLVSARRHDEADPHDQVAVILSRRQVALTDSGTWHALGMRGTSSAGHTLVAAGFADWQVLPTPFPAIVQDTMLPWSHLLWSSVWTGLAKEALRRAGQVVRSGKVVDVRLAEAHAALLAARDNVHRTAQLVEEGLGRGASLPMSMAVRLNNLKLATSSTCVQVALKALEICGMRGYSEEGEFSVARILRDLLSAPLMIGNGRLLAANAQLLSSGREFV
jgi:acyl-CoA dehydrogenase